VNTKDEMVVMSIWRPCGDGGDRLWTTSSFRSKSSDFYSYVVGHDIDIPQMELYSRVSKDLQRWIEKSNEDEAGEGILKATPELFEKFRDTDEESKAELLHQLKLTKQIPKARRSRNGMTGNSNGSNGCTQLPTKVSTL